MLACRVEDRIGPRLCGSFAPATASVGETAVAGSRDRDLRVVRSYGSCFACPGCPCRYAWIAKMFVARACLACQGPVGAGCGASVHFRHLVVRTSYHYPSSAGSRAACHRSLAAAGSGTENVPERSRVGLSVPPTNSTFVTGAACLVGPSASLQGHSSVRS